MRVKRMKRVFFTITELMIASTISGVVMAIMMSFWIASSKTIASGQKQLVFHSSARWGVNKVVKGIQDGSTVKLLDNGTKVAVANTDGSFRYIYFNDGDSDPETINDNRIYSDDDGSVDGDETLLVQYVNQLDGVKFFTRVGTGVKITFHVGDAIGVKDSTQGYMGVDVNTSAAPRNIQ